MRRASGLTETLSRHMRSVELSTDAARNLCSRRRVRWCHSALVAAVVSPVTTWLIARGTQDHERRLAQDDRVFDRRSETYKDVLRDGRRDIRAFGQAMDPEDEPPDPSVFGTPDEWADLEARTMVFGSSLSSRHTRSTGRQWPH